MSDSETRGKLLADVVRKVGGNHHREFEDPGHFAVDGPGGLEDHLVEAFFFDGIGIGASGGENFGDDCPRAVVVAAHEVGSDKVAAFFVVFAGALVHIDDVAVGVGYGDCTVDAPGPVGEGGMIFGSGDFEVGFVHGNVSELSECKISENRRDFC